MGRRKLYQTDEERLQAKRARARRSYHKRKQERPIDDEFNRLLEINPDLYPTKHKLSDEQKSFIKSLMNLPLDIKPATNRDTRQNDSIAKQMLGIAKSKIRNKKRQPIKSLDFDVSLLRNESERQYFYEHLPNVINELLDSIDFNTEHWMVYYKYENTWKTRTLDNITEQYLKDQIKNDLQEHLHDFVEYGADYDFFPVMIQQLTQIRFINIDEVETTAQPTRKKREGRFWRWLLKGFPEIHLERFMIFNQLNDDAANIIQRDNCFIYACKMAGLSEETLNDMRYSIQKRSMSHKDIERVAHEHDLKLHIKSPTHSYYINAKGTHEVRIVLMHNHYMIDEKVDVSPYYILHKKEITCHPIARHWSKENQMQIDGKSKGSFTKCKSKFSLRKVIDALFKVNAFKPISMNDYRVYASLVCFENVEPIKSLEYDARYCCRLKTMSIYSSMYKV